MGDESIRCAETKINCLFQAERIGICRTVQIPIFVVCSTDSFYVSGFRSFYNGIFRKMDKNRTSYLCRWHENIFSCGKTVDILDGICYNKHIPVKRMQKNEYFNFSFSHCWNDAVGSNIGCVILYFSFLYKAFIFHLTDCGWYVIMQSQTGKQSRYIRKDETL